MARKLIHDLIIVLMILSSITKLRSPAHIKMKNGVRIAHTVLRYPMHHFTCLGTMGKEGGGGSSYLSLFATVTGHVS